MFQGQCLHPVKYKAGYSHHSGNPRLRCSTCGKEWTQGNRDAPLTILANLATHFKNGRTRKEAVTATGYDWHTVRKYYAVFERRTGTGARRADNKSKTHCIHGHEFTEQNTAMTKHGYRDCLACRKEKAMKRSREKPEPGRKKVVLPSTRKEAQMQIGQHVIFADSQRVEHDALVTAVWGPDTINVVYTSPDENRTDQYGRQVVRETSVARYSDFSCYGRSFREPGTDKPEYKSYPAAV